MYELTGTYLGQYHLTEIISYGGTSTVYKAYQSSLDRYVAVKVLLHNRDPQFAARFKREARLVAQLQHPNILPIYEYGEHEGMLYLVLRYVERGATLDGMLGAPMEPVRALRLTSLLLAALDHAHGRGIIHRDVKPANVLMSAPDWPLLADFGIAKFTRDDLRLTNTGLIIGTAAYMSPEQATGEPLDPRSDVYSTGVVLYEMLTGQVPFDGTSAMALLHKHVHTPPPALRSLVPELPEAVEAVVLRALEKDPAARYQSAAEMAEALEQVAADLERAAEQAALAPAMQAETVPVMPAREASAAPEPPRMPPPRHAWPSWNTVLMALVLIGGGGGLGWLGIQQVGAQNTALVVPTATATTPPTNTATATLTPLPTDTLTPTDAPTPTVDLTATAIMSAALEAARQQSTAQAEATQTEAAIQAEATAQADMAATTEAAAARQQATAEAAAAAREQATAQAKAAARQKATAQAQAAAATARARQPVAAPVPPAATPVPPTNTPVPPTPTEKKKDKGGGGGGGGGGPKEPPPPGKDP